VYKFPPEVLNLKRRNLFHITLPHHFKASLILSFHLRHVFEVTPFRQGYHLNLMIIHHQVELPNFFYQEMYFTDLCETHKNGGELYP